MITTTIILSITLSRLKISTHLLFIMRGTSDTAKMIMKVFVALAVVVEMGD